MTREEREDAINFLKGYLDEEVYTEKCRNAHEMAIKSLEKELCEDAISRQTVLDMMQMKMGDKELYKAVYDLPPVTPKPKMGHWIDVESLDSALWYACSECGETEFHATNYCPNCGAKMERAFRRGIDSESQCHLNAEDEEVVYKGLYLRGEPNNENN